MNRIAIIGTGLMGAPIARALWKAGHKVAVINRTAAKAEALAYECPGMAVYHDAASACAGADIVILAVKPHIILKELSKARHACPYASFVSLAPGITLAELEAYGANKAIRLMPNVAIDNGEGMSFLCHNAEAHADAQLLAHSLEATGRVAVVEERLFEPAMAVASCGIAYALRYARASAEAAIALGLTPADATSYIAQTLRGAAAMLDTGIHPEALIDSVTTPGGSTIRGLMAMERAGFSAAVAEGLTACVSPRK